MRARSSDTITVAAGQIQARLMNDAAASLEAIALAIQRAAEKRVDLLVLPECAYPAYLIGSIPSYRAGVRQESDSQGGHFASGEFIAWLSQRAARHRLHLVCGFIEDTAGAVYNAAVLLDDRGR